MPRLVDALPKYRKHKASGQAVVTLNGVEHYQSLLESRDEYTAERVFWVPPDSRWPNLQNQATRPDIATLIDDAILAVERDNPNSRANFRATTPAAASSRSRWPGPATIKEIAGHGHVLTPGRYVGAEDVEEDAEPFAEKYPRLVRA